MEKESKIKKKIKRCRQLVKAGWCSCKEEGLKTAAKKTLNVIGVRRKITYKRWAKTPLYTDGQLEKQRNFSFDRQIKFSIITPLYNTCANHLTDMIESVLDQTYSNWELCLADGSDERHSYVGEICRDYKEKDSRIKYKKLDQNYGIAGNSNACIEMAEGEYISILDHDDMLHPAALHDILKKICDEDADFIYTDEALFRDPHLHSIVGINYKPDYAPDTLKAINYICHFTSFKRSLIEKSGVFRDGFDGSQDHELFLRLTDNAEHIAHVSEVLYYWRAHDESTAENADNKSYTGEMGKKAVRSHLKAKGIKAIVENAKGLPTAYRISYEIPKKHPEVDIIIPNCEHVEDLDVCVTSIIQKTTYDNYKIIIVENNSKGPEIFEFYNALEKEHDNITICTWPGDGFNWSAINNYAIREAARGDYILLLNNDTEVITPDWIQEMLMYAQRADVGMVGAMLYYPDDTIQHAGVVIGLGETAGHVFVRHRRGEKGYMSRLCYVQNLSAVTGACMMMRRSVYDQLGGIDEQLAGGYNDIDLCLRIREAGYLVIWTPFAELYHNESKSRGVFFGTMEDRTRNRQEIDLFRSRWADVLEKGDPYYNSNLSLKSSNFDLKMKNERL